MESLGILQIMYLHGAASWYEIDHCSLATFSVLDLRGNTLHIATKSLVLSDFG